MLQTERLRKKCLIKRLKKGAMLNMQTRHWGRKENGFISSKTALRQFANNIKYQNNNSLWMKIINFIK